MEVLVSVFFAAVGIQAIFFAAFFVAFTRNREERSPTDQPVSIVVCAHDELPNLKELIPLLLAQNYSHFEVIIVDDRSNDTTLDFLLEETKKDHRLRMVHVNRNPEHVNGKKYGITLGIRAAAHNWLLLTDADCRPASKNWIREISKQFNSRTQFVLGFSPYFKTQGWLNSFIRFEGLITAIQYLSFALLKNPYMGVGRNLAYRKSFFLENKGFNNFLHVTGGDDDLFVNQHSNGQNTSIAIGADAVVQSIPKNTWKSFFHQKIRHLSVGKRYRFDHRILLGLFTLSWLVTWFVGLPLMIDVDDYSWILGALIFRSVLLIIVLQTVNKRLGSSFESWKVPALDFLYSIYYISTGLVTLLTRKIRWRK